MKNWKVFCTWVVGIALFLIVAANPVYANSNQLHRLDYEVELFEDGSGRIIETRNISIVEGTENFIELNGLTESDILDYEVYANGDLLEQNDNWDSGLSREEKSGQYGLIDVGSGIELVWGIGEYGEHTYEIHYTVDDMVRQLEDGQSMYWAFFRGDDSLMPSEMTLTVQSPEQLTEENTTVALLGLEGANWELANGEFIAEKSSPLVAGEDVILLLQFEDELFHSLVPLDMTMAEQQDQALEDSAYNEESASDNGGGVPFFVIFGAIFVLSNSVAVFLMLFSRAKNKQLVRGQKRLSMNSGKYSSAIPYDGNITDVAFFLKGIRTGNFDDYFFAFLMKWAKEQRISIQPETNPNTGRKYNSIKLLELSDPDGPVIEKEFWDMMLEAADEEGVILEGDLKDWAEDNYSVLHQMEKDLPKDSKNFLLENGFLSEDKVKVLGFIKTDVLRTTEKGEALYNQLVQFQNFAESFERSEVSEEEIREIDNWEDFLVWSSVFGLASKVVNELEGHFPEFWDDYVEMYPYFGGYYGMYGYHSSFSRGYKAGAPSSSSSGSFSSGSSGTSFGGGGGGSFGGGSSGVR